MTTLARTFAALAPVLRQHAGLTTPALATSAGVSSQQLARLVDAGLLERLARGVYAGTAQPDSWERRAMAASLRAGDRAALSHGAAARLLGLEQTWAGRAPALEVTVPRGARPRGDVAARLHESAHLDPARDLVRVGPFTVTGAAWTLAALCARLDLGRAERMVDAAVANRQVTRAELAAVRDRWWHTPGVAVLRAVLLREVSQVVATRSEAERSFLRIVRDAGLPLPEPNVRVTDASGRVRYLDMAYREHGIAIEIDVHPAHGTSLGRSRDGGRQNDLVPAWIPLRFDAHDLQYRHAEVADQVRRALIAVGALAA